MDKQMLRTTITQLRQIALFAVGVSLLTACGNSQGGMKLGDSEYAVMTVNSSSSDQTTSYPATIRGTQDQGLLLSYVLMKGRQFVKTSPCLKSIRHSIKPPTTRRKLR